MRIVSGLLKARRFSIPKNFPSRPTTDFAKEGLFNILEHQIDLEDLDILDLCAGTGNISFEFASREAGKITVVDQNYNCIKYIQETSKKFEIDSVITTIKSEIIKYLKQTNAQFDIIFADPPYEFKFYDEIIEETFNRNLLKKNGVLIIEHSHRLNLKEKPHFETMRNFGNVSFSFFKKEI